MEDWLHENENRRQRNQKIGEYDNMAKGRKGGMS